MQPSDDIERTALQVACYLGNFIGVNWLVAHGAIANVSVHGAYV